MQRQATAQQQAATFIQTLTPAQQALLATYNLAYLQRRFARQRRLARQAEKTKPKKLKNKFPL